jgi:hypothetical protein
MVSFSKLLSCWSCVLPGFWIGGGCFVFLCFLVPAELSGDGVFEWVSVVRKEGVFLCVFGRVVWIEILDIDLRFSLHYCTILASSLGSPASSDVRRVPHRPLLIDAWHARVRDLPGAWWPRATLLASTMTSDGDSRRIGCFPAGGSSLPSPSLCLGSVFFCFVCGFLSCGLSGHFRMWGCFLSDDVFFN